MTSAANDTNDSSFVFSDSDDSTLSMDNSVIQLVSNTKAAAKPAAKPSASTSAGNDTQGDLLLRHSRPASNGEEEKSTRQMDALDEERKLLRTFSKLREQLSRCVITNATLQQDESVWRAAIAAANADMDNISAIVETLLSSAHVQYADYEFKIADQVGQIILSNCRMRRSVHDYTEKLGPEGVARAAVALDVAPVSSTTSVTRPPATPDRAQPAKTSGASESARKYVSAATRTPEGSRKPAEPASAPAARVRYTSTPPASPTVAARVDVGSGVPAPRDTGRTPRALDFDKRRDEPSKTPSGARLSERTTSSAAAPVTASAPNRDSRGRVLSGSARDGPLREAAPPAGDSSGVYVSLANALVYESDKPASPAPASPSPAATTTTTTTTTAAPAAAAASEASYGYSYAPSSQHQQATPPASSAYAGGSPHYPRYADSQPSTAYGASGGYTAYGSGQSVYGASNGYSASGGYTAAGGSGYTQGSVYNSPSGGHQYSASGTPYGSAYGGSAYGGTTYVTPEGYTLSPGGHVTAPRPRYQGDGWS